MSGAIHFSTDPTEFAGKQALVTGATKGMGEAIVRRLAALQQGAGAQGRPREYGRAGLHRNDGGPSPHRSARRKGRD